MVVVSKQTTMQQFCLAWVNTRFFWSVLPGCHSCSLTIFADYKSFGKQQGQSYRFMYSRGLVRRIRHWILPAIVMPHAVTRFWWVTTNSEWIRWWEKYKRYHQRSRISTTISQDLQDWGNSTSQQVKISTGIPLMDITYCELLAAIPLYLGNAIARV